MYIDHYQCNQCQEIVLSDGRCNCGADDYTEVYQCEQCGEWEVSLYEGHCPACFNRISEESEMWSETVTVLNRYR